MRVLPFPPPAGFCAVRTCSVCPSPVSHRRQSQVSRVRALCDVCRSRQTRKKRTSPPPPSFQPKRAAHTSHERTGTDRPLLLLLLRLHTSLHSPLQVFPRTINTRLFFLAAARRGKREAPLNPHLVHFSGAQVQSFMGRKNSSGLDSDGRTFSSRGSRGGNKFARTYVVSRSAGPSSLDTKLALSLFSKRGLPPGRSPSAFSLFCSNPLRYQILLLLLRPPIFPLLSSPYLSAAARRGSFRSSKRRGFFCSPPPPQRGSHLPILRAGSRRSRGAQISCGPPNPSPKPTQPAARVVCTLGWG